MPDTRALTDRDPSALVGLVPAAGAGSRLGALPCSKEIYPLARPASASDVSRPIRAACNDLLEAYVRAGIAETYVVLGHGKWDIPSYLGEDAELGLDLAYLTIDESPSTVHTIDRARAFVASRRVAFGFPDIIFRPLDAFSALGEHQLRTGADLVLGLFPATSPAKVDMVELDASSTVRHIVIKPEHTDLRLTWLLAVWGGRFTDYVHSFLSTQEHGGAAGTREPFVGDVIQAAIEDGWRVQGVPFANGAYHDIGTPDDLVAAVRAPFT